MEDRGRSHKSENVAIRAVKALFIDDIIINFPWNFDIREIETSFDIWQGIYQSELLKI